eukprot:3716008-Amphidinium_carterae.1
MVSKSHSSLGLSRSIWLSNNCAPTRNAVQTLLQNYVWPKASAWALFVKQGQARLPSGNQCAECYTLWMYGFVYMQWQELCDAYATNKAVAAAVDRAREVQKGEANRPPNPPEVATIQSTQINIERVYIAVTERDMKKAAQREKIPRAALRGCNVVTMDSLDGKAKENVYLFAHPDYPHKMARVIVGHEARLHKPVMSPDKALWVGQGEKFQGMAIQSLGEATFGTFNNKEMGGHAMTMTFDEFLKERLSMADDDEEDEGEVQGEEYEGVAAGSALKTPEDTKKKPKKPYSSLLRLSSKTSMPDSTDAASAQPSALGDGTSRGADDDADFDNGVRDQTSWTTGGQALAHWRSKVPLIKVVDNTIDNRSIVGLKRACLTAARKDKTIAQLLQNYQSLVKVCQTVAGDGFTTATDSEVGKAVEVLQAENLSVPFCLKQAILNRRVFRLKAERKFKDLVDVMDPFKKSDEFNHTAPILACLGDGNDELKVNNFKKILVKDVIVGLVNDGEESANVLQELCLACLNHHKEVDTLYLSNAASSCYTSSMVIWNALAALLDPQLDCKEDVAKIKASIGQARSTMLTWVATAVQASPFYSHMLDDFMAKAPAMVEYSERVLQWQQKLQAMLAGSVSFDALCDLQAISEAIPTLIIALRTGSLGELVQDFRKAIEKVWALTETEVELTLEQTTALSKLLHSASTLMPTDVDLNRWLQDVGQMIHKQGEKSLASGILAQVNKVLGTPLDAVQDVVQAVCALDHKLATSFVQPALLLQSGGTSWSNLVKHLLDVLCSLDKETKSAEIFDMAKCVKSIGSLFPDSDINHIAIATWAGVGLMRSLELAAEGTSAAPPKTALMMTQTLELNRKLTKFAEATKHTNHELFKHAFFNVLNDCVATAKEMVAKSEQQLSDVAKQDLQTTTGALQEVAKGGVGGASWISSYGGSADWADFSKYASENFKIDPDDFNHKLQSVEQVQVGDATCKWGEQPKMSICEFRLCLYKLVHHNNYMVGSIVLWVHPNFPKALAKYEEITKAFDAPPGTHDMNIPEDAKGTLLAGRVTLCEHKLMDAFSKHSSSINELRPAVVDAIKILCGHGLKENECLHKVLLQKVKSTLAMKG